MRLAELISNSDFQFQMRFLRGDIAQFFDRTPEHERLLAERRHWFQSDPARYAAVLPDGVPLLEEALALAGQLASTGCEPAPALEPANQTPIEQCLALAQWWEPDFLLLKPDDHGRIRLCAGGVCFPSSWDLGEKMGQPIEAIHGVVPGLNAQIGQQIHAFLAKLKPGSAWQRTNWGLSRSSELNQHPSRGLPRLDSSVALNDVWFRVEHQALVALPGTGGILFAIRLSVHPLRELRVDSEACRRLARALATMPEDVLQYKGLSSARAPIVSWLNDTGDTSCR